MSHWIESKYISLISPRLDHFKQKSSKIYNFKCPICGDSHKNKNKARGYIYLKNDIFWYHCHNCNFSRPFKEFLKIFDSSYYDSLLRESFTNQYEKKKIFEKKKGSSETKDYSLKDLKRLDTLSPNNLARKYIISRKLPTKYHTELFLCEKFKEWTNTLIPNKFKDISLDEERIVIPFFDYNDKMFGYQGRTIGNKKSVRYITILLDEEKPKIWGLNHVDLNRKFYVTEGPFDAMLLDNSIATAGGKIISEISKINCNQNNAIIVYDNEPRNRDVCSNIENAIKSGFSVVIWPSNLIQKDINEMHLSELNYKKIISENIFNGLKAQIRFSQWKKI